MEKLINANISARIAQKRKELEQLEKQAKMEVVQKTVDAVTKAINNSSYTRTILCDFSPEEGKIIGRHMAGINYRTISSRYNIGSSILNI